MNQSQAQQASKEETLRTLRSPEIERDALAYFLGFSNIGMFSEEDLLEILKEYESWEGVKAEMFGRLQSLAETEEMWNGFMDEIKYWKTQVTPGAESEVYWILEWGELCEKAGVLSAV